ncbi:MAG: repressor LexA [Gemmatimonadaceae bacterium]|nr:repressor LexA [Gemmatimonadaceae bacterium]
MPLTKRQREILSFLSEYNEVNGFAPSFEEIASRFNYNSLATVHEHLTNLERKGYIKRSYNESRAIEILPSEVYQRAVELPLLGSVAAGAPIEAMHAGETMAVPDGFLRKSGSHYVLRVRGDSMIEEHIRDGDYVVINDKQAADNGEMVIALVDGGGPRSSATTVSVTGASACSRPTKPCSPFLCTRMTCASRALSWACCGATELRRY